MKAHNFNEKILQYINANPNLSNNELGILLLVDNLYLELPYGIEEFKLRYPHFDAKIVDNGHDGITFLDIIKENLEDKIICKRLNNYLNIKFNSIGNIKTITENKIIFEKYSKIVSRIINDLLVKGQFPVELIEILNEREEIRGCHDIFQLTKIYKSTTIKRLRYAILRRIGLVVLIARIKRAFSFDDLEFATNEIERSFKRNLIDFPMSSKSYFYWADHNYKGVFSEDEVQAKIKYELACQKKEQLASKVYDMQVFRTEPFMTKQGNKILNFEIRNKLYRDGEEYFTSIVEKMIRKNLEFPNQVHDIIGLKIVVPTSDDIPKLIDELETFLGGSSTRKKEKNVLNKFGKIKLNKHTSGEYFVWKAIYDIALPHPSIEKVQEIVDVVKDKDSKVYDMLTQRMEYFRDNPRDFVVEVQIQDLDSYILSSAKGSIPHHSIMKMVQIKENSFFKLFPLEIYKDELLRFKHELLNRKD